jgi:hypothetical protein
VKKLDIMRNRANKKIRGVREWINKRIGIEK